MDDLFDESTTSEEIHEPCFCGSGTPYFLCCGDIPEKEFDTESPTLDTGVPAPIDEKITLRF